MFGDYPKLILLSVRRCDSGGRPKQAKIVKSFTKEGMRQQVTYKKWEMISSHTARRSFATNEYLAGTPTLTIMAITGHKTEKSFLRYIKLTSAEHAKLLRAHWDKRKEAEMLSVA